MNQRQKLQSTPGLFHLPFVGRTWKQTAMVEYGLVDFNNLMRRNGNIANVFFLIQILQLCFETIYQRFEFDSNHDFLLHTHVNMPRKRLKFRVSHAPGILGTFSPPPRVSDPDIHHGTCVSHVPWCIPGSLTSGFIWSRWRGKRSRHSRRMRNKQSYVSGKRPTHWLK